MMMKASRIQQNDLTQTRKKGSCAEKREQFHVRDPSKKSCSGLTLTSRGFQWGSRKKSYSTKSGCYQSSERQSYICPVTAATAAIKTSRKNIPVFRLPYKTD